MLNVSVINKIENKVNVEVNEVDGVVQIVIDKALDMKKLSSLKPGEVFKKNGTEYIVCEHFENGSTAIIRKECLEDGMEFGDTNNWAESGLRKFLNNEYLKNISDDFSQDNILDHEVDLLSLDGYDDYGRTTDKVSVLTIDQYRKYHKFIGNVDRWNWLATPDSIPSGTDASGVQVVRGSGRVGWRCSDDCCGVRPFFLLKSSISVSPETGE